MQKHGYLHSSSNPSGLPIFRMEVKNLNQYLGIPSYTPQYVYMRKHDGKLAELRMFDSTPKSDNFCKMLQEYANLGEEFSQKVQYDVNAQL